MIVLSLGEHVFRIRECRNPAAVAELRVPPTMVDVQMGATDVIDLLRRDASLGKSREKGQILLMKSRQRWPILVVPAAAVNQDHVPWRLQNPGVDTGDEAILHLIEARGNHQLAMLLQ